MTLQQWSEKRLAEWIKVESYHSTMGWVERAVGADWLGRVNLPNGKVARLSETFASAEVAMGAVERTWKRENGK